MGMTMTRWLSEMTSVELSQRLALDNIRYKERKQQERMDKAKRRK